MKRILQCAVFGALVCMLGSGDADGRGFGGFRAGGFGGGGLGGGGFSSFRGGSVGSFGGADRNLGYSGFRSADNFSGLGSSFGGGAYDRSFTDNRGGSVNIAGDRGFASGPLGGFAAGGSRDITATGAGGRTISSDKQGGVAVGPYGRVIGGGTKTGMAIGPGGTITGSSHTAFAAGRLPTDVGLSHFSSFNAAAVGHTTNFWSNNYMVGRANVIRGGFGYYNCFRPGWNALHPGAWYAAGWAAGAAWEAATWSMLNSLWAITAPPIYYDYGTTIVYQNNYVYVNGQDVGTAQNYAQQATTLADQGQKAAAPPEQEWKSLGVFALAQGDEQISNNIFQLAVDKEGVMRGSYYDGLMDSTTPIYGSVDKKTQRAAWTIGKKNDRVFETGIYNLTKSETPVLVHFGADRTQQWLLVRVNAPKDSK